MKPPILQTKRYTLKPYQLKEEALFVEMGIDPKSVAFMGGANGIAEEERALFRKIFELYLDDNSSRVFWIWGIYSQDTLCGHFELKETNDTAEDELEIVYMVHPAARRQGLMTEVLLFFKENQSLWKKRIIATVAPTNKLSLAILKKWGITKQENREGEGKKYLKVYLEE